MLKRSIKLAFFLGIILFAYRALAFFSDSKDGLLSFENATKTVYINDNGLTFSVDTSANTLEDLLKEKNIKLGEHDQIIPLAATPIFPGINVEIRRAMRVKIDVDGKEIDNYTLARSVGEALIDNKVTLSRLDKTNPSVNLPFQNNQTIVVTRINEEEVVIPEDIDFKTVTKTDSKMGWRDKKIEQPGEKGIKEVKYKITYKNGKEISRIVLGKNITKDPVTQVETQGTYVKCGNADKGQATWYSYQGGMYAASLSIPRGGYARVTNTANGKSIIVQINDSGPYGKGRIIDLDKVAFQKIGSIGAGVISVKVEEVLN